MQKERLETPDLEERLAPQAVKVSQARPEGPAYKESPVQKEKPEALERQAPREQTG